MFAFRRQYEKQIRIAERVSYRQARRIYLDAFIEGSKKYLENQSFQGMNLVDVIKFRNLYIDIYHDTGMRFAKWYTRLFQTVAKKQNTFEEDIWEMVFRRYGEDQAGRLVTTVNQTMQDQFLATIQRQFQDPTFASLGVPEQARILYSDGFWGKKARWMALRVARTENNTAANLAINEASLSLFGSNQMQKIWDTSEDERVRDTHRQAGSIGAIPFDGWFQVGSVRMRFPNDPQAQGIGKEVARERINCRCRMVTIPKEEIFEDLYTQVANEFRNTV